MQHVRALIDPPRLKRVRVFAFARHGHGKIHSLPLRRVGGLKVVLIARCRAALLQGRRYVKAIYVPIAAHP
jgi:hypothetical protein